MLGRGLEALIPPQGSNGTPQPHNPQPQGSQGYPYQQELPAQQPEERLMPPVTSAPLMLHVHEDDEPAVAPYVAPQQTQHVNYADMRPEAQGEQFQAQTYHYGMPPTPIREEQPVVQSEPEPVRQPLVAPSHYQTKQSVAPVSYSGVFNPVLVSEDEAKKPYEAVFQLDIDRIRPNPHQPRRVFDDDALRDLAASIREFGILQPLVVAKVERETPNGTEVNYELIAGERRWRASKLVGLPRVPAIIRQISVDRERLELAIIENLQREQLNAVEMARAYARLQDEFNMTQREVASRLGKSREVVANTLRLLDLPSDVQTAIEDGRISESHGRLLLGVTDPALQQSLFKDLLERQLTTRELRDRVSGSSQRGRKPARQAREAQPLSPELQMLQERLSSDLGAPVRIQATGEVGKITISFYSREELSAILEHLAAEADILL